MLNITNLTNIVCGGEEQFEGIFSKFITEETLLPTVLPIKAINNTVLLETFPDFNNPLILLEAFFLGLIILLTISGNLLVIVAVVPSPTLRSPTHSLIVNLAVADLLLGITVLPLSATRELYAGAWLLGPSLCSVWTSLDVLCCTASILSLCGISVDRYIGVSRPLAYSRILTKRRARILIAVIWTLALAISIAPPLGWKEEVVVTDTSDNECQVNKDLGYVIFSACGSFYIPALVIIVLYFLVYRAAIRHSMFLSSGSRVTRSDVTLRVHMGSTRISAASRTSLCEPVINQHKVRGDLQMLLYNFIVCVCVLIVIFPALKLQTISL